MIHLEVITDAAALPALLPEWEALWERCPAATPFQSPCWLLPWWRQFGTPHPRVAVLRDGGALTGLLPLYRLAERLLPIGVGISDYLDVLIAPEAPPDAASLLLRCALRKDTSCDLPELPTASPLRDAAAPAGWDAELLPGETCPALTLGATLAETIPPRMLRKLRMNRHRADRAGAWRVETAGADDLAGCLDALIRLNDTRWQGAGVFSDSRVRAFHAEAAPLLLAAGLLRLIVLRLEGIIIGAIHALQDRADRLFLHLGGYDAAHGFCSPGSLLLGALVEQAIAEGRRELDFLRGNEGYKHEWGARDRHNAVRRLRRAQPGSRLIASTLASSS